MRDDIIIAIDDASVQKLLQRIKNKIGNLKPVMQVIGEIIRTSVDQNFETNGRYSDVGSWRGGSSKWQELAKSTKKAKLAKGRDPSNILRDTGRLVASIVAKATGDSVKVGTNLVYAAIHQFGGVIDIPPGKKTLRFRKEKNGALMTQITNKNLLYFAGKRHKRVHEWEVSVKGHKITIPARPFLVVQDDDLTQIRETILNFISAT